MSEPAPVLVAAASACKHPFRWRQAGWEMRRSGGSIALAHVTTLTCMECGVELRQEEEPLPVPAEAPAEWTTDLGRMREMFSRAGVVFRDTPACEYVKTEHPGSETVLFVDAQAGPHNHGYTGFQTQMGFDGEGTLLWVAAWE